MPETSQDSQVPFTAGCSPVCDVVRRPKRRKRRSRPWHRMLGLLATLPLVWVLVTGFFLNHSEDFGLDQKHTTSPWLMKAYGMMPEGEPRSIALDSQQLVEWDGLVFLDGAIVEQAGRFVGGASGREATVVVFEESVVLFDLDGRVIETLDELSLPGLPLTGVGQVGEQVVVRNADGWHSADADWIEWTSVEGGSEVKERTMGLLDDAESRQDMIGLWNGGGVSYYRLVLDLHAGNFLGDFAKYFYDLVILCTLWLIGTGLVLQYRASKRSKVKP
ncbi:PepSY domain-containing protein [Rubritalea tangerina]|uniref:PepSY domain-containing protein n=1 Tax=Rubritalea tangerina TaxID=430798 RepID=A0ABW4Z7C7_9BACT